MWQNKQPQPVTANVQGAGCGGRTQDLGLINYFLFPLGYGGRCVEEVFFDDWLERKHNFKLDIICVSAASSEQSGAVVSVLGS